MGVAYYIALEPSDPHAATAVDGKVLARAFESLNAIGQQLGLGTLDDFFGASDEMLEEFGIDAGTPSPWFDPAAGLRWFESVTAHIAANRSSVQHPDELIAELKDFAAVLRKAEATGAKWHLAIDI